jgi:hypothetical protein
VVPTTSKSRERVFLISTIAVRCYADGMPTQFLYGRPLSQADLDGIRRDLEAMESIEVVTDQLREIVVRNWPHLVAKLPPHDEQSD